jgi:signal transduction histidine kinase
MSFRVTARTILHLGSELISSDSIALYELVKNAFDAGSKRATIDVFVRIPYENVRASLASLAAVENGSDKARDALLDNVRNASLPSLDMSTPDAKVLRKQIASSSSIEKMKEVLTEANYLTVSDSGEGMSLETLRTVYLTIGTRSRLLAREKQSSENGNKRIFLGEKGVGRLSAMRLGSRLHVESTTVGERHWNILDIDWSVFSHEREVPLESIHIEPSIGARKDSAAVSGTRIRISGLHTEWSKDRLIELARDEFSKLTDPFTSNVTFPVQLRFNGEAVSIPRFTGLLLDNAHGSLKASFEKQAEIGQTEAGMRLSGTVRYKGREKTFALEGVHLASTAKSDPRILDLLGPFSVELYWYNRRILEALEGIGDRDQVKRLVNEWAGGLMVFRDGFRVMPYGSPDDDWLELDKKALGSGGYKVNRRQIIGRVRISSRRNPRLVDQTNREGLRDSEEKRALICLLKYLIQTEFRTFLNETDQSIDSRASINIDDLEERVSTEEERVENNLKELVRRVPGLGSEKRLMDEVSASLERLRAVMTEVRELADSFEAGRGQLLNLAGVGLTVEILAHELNRATEHALATLHDMPENGEGKRVDALVRTLEAQLKTLQKRLKILDPLSTAGRNRKETFDVVALVQETLDAHQEQFERERLKLAFSVKSSGRQSRLVVKAVKGMIVQVLENLLANSVYWLRQEAKLNPKHEARIEVVVDVENRMVSVTDNGPGIPPDLRERVFEAFFTTKPAGLGKGLGLYIAREIARYHGADLFLSEDPKGPRKALHSFILTVESMAT